MQLSLQLPPAAAHSYPILIESGLWRQADVWRQLAPHRQVCIVSNPSIAPLYLAQIKAALGDKEIIEVLIPDGEQYKNLEEYAKVLDALIAHRFGRDALIIALGGGVVGDLAGFAAASYQRGMDFIQCPTTLLAQVDSSVGGKTGVNHPSGKNMIGAFHQPLAVLIDIDTLNTLPAREFSAGLAEVIKYGLINDIAFFEWLESNIGGIMAKDKKLLIKAIAHCCQNKADVVCADEKEHGQRALLNLGHTFGHALESISLYRLWKHGEAVAIGMRMAAELAHLRGELKASELTRIIALLQAAQLPIDMDEEFSVEEVYNAMFLDKKVRSGKLRLVAMSGLGQCRIDDEIPAEQILAAIRLAGVRHD